MHKEANGKTKNITNWFLCVLQDPSYSQSNNLSYSGERIIHMCGLFSSLSSFDWTFSDLFVIVIFTTDMMMVSPYHIIPKQYQNNSKL